MFDKGASKCPITVILLSYLLVQILCLTSLFFILLTDSIMALYAPKSQNNQPQMYNVPGGVYITPQQHQQQPRPAAPAMFNRMGTMPVHGVSMGMGPQLGNPHQQVVMQQRQQQQQQQVKLFLKSPFNEWGFLLSDRNLQESCNFWFCFENYYDIPIKIKAILCSWMSCLQWPPKPSVLGNSWSIIRTKPN